jgi:transposase
VPRSTHEYNIEVINRQLRRLLGVGPRAPIGSGTVNSLLGLSLDEVQRMKPARERWVTIEWPLIDLRMTRHDCLLWLARNGYPIPPKSSCIGCPFHSDADWREMRDHRPAEWEDACDFDERIRQLRRPGSELELAEAGPAGERARRGGDRALGAGGVARDKKHARRKQAWIVFEDESGASLTPVVRRTWAPRGKTPVLRHPFNWKRISMAAALAYRWDGARTRLYFQTREGTYNEESLIEFVRELGRHFRGQQVILIWDGLPSHRSRLMSQFLAKQRHWLEVKRLPAYTPELNPVEGLWSNLKSQELANRCETHLKLVTLAAGLGASRVRSQSSLLFGFLGQTGLQI